jgi:hypothetical protein
MEVAEGGGVAKRQDPVRIAPEGVGKEVAVRIIAQVARADVSAEEQVREDLGGPIILKKVINGQTHLPTAVDNEGVNAVQERRAGGGDKEVAGGGEDVQGEELGVAGEVEQVGKGQEHGEGVDGGAGESQEGEGGDGGQL